MGKFFLPLVLTAVCASGQILGDGTGQPAEARINQAAAFLQYIALVKSLGIQPSAGSQVSWWEVSGPVGPVTVDSVIAGSAAAAAGLHAGDVIIQIRRIPSYRIRLFMQAEEIQGGAAQLGFNIDRAAREFGFTKVTLRVRRGGAVLDVPIAIQ